MIKPDDSELNNYFYRFRSVENLLGDRLELDGQTIYFASQDQLNDPLEGHINVYWEGDAVTWRNLFSHYLNCVIYIFNLWRKYNELKEDLTWESIPARDPLALGMYPEHHELARIFFNNPSVVLLINKIVGSARRVGRNELTAHLRAVHYFVLATIQSIYRKRQDPSYVESFSESAQLAIELERIKSAVDLFDIAEQKACGNAEEIEKYYVDVIKGYEEVDLLNYYTEAIKLSDKNRVFVVNDFSQAYVRRLGTLIYPAWYTACFMEDCSAASMWAYYGESHAGVCLKFKTEHDSHHRTLNLNTISGYGSDGKMYSMRSHQFKPVIYQSQHESLNFFDSLGAITQPVANSQWYTNRAGEVSKQLLLTESEREEWRRNHWDRFGLINRTKTASWEAEKEHRLIYYSLVADLSAQDRTLTYDFASLEGVIFGVRTPIDKKIAIAKVIERKCRENGRSDFNFYQAHFSNNQSEMIFTELKILPSISVPS